MLYKIPSSKIYSIICTIQHAQCHIQVLTYKIFFSKYFRVSHSQDGLYQLTPIANNLENFYIEHQSHHPFHKFIFPWQRHCTQTLTDSQRYCNWSIANIIKTYSPCSYSIPTIGRFEIPSITFINRREPEANINPEGTGEINEQL